MDSFFLPIAVQLSMERLETGHGKKTVGTVGTQRTRPLIGCRLLLSEAADQSGATAGCDWAALVH